MFTGLIQNTTRLKSVRTGGRGALVLERANWDSPLAIGESIAVQGVCLTLTAFDASTLVFDLLDETLRRTCLGSKKPGNTLNLERALRMGDPLGGHLVSGHVDGVGRIRTLRRVGEDWAVEIACERSVLADLVSKGSVACDGISLTIVDVADDAFTVHVIPHTFSATAFRELGIGDSVNVETDILAKYVRRALERGREGVTMDSLRKSGFVE